MAFKANAVGHQTKPDTTENIAQEIYKPFMTLDVALKAKILKQLAVNHTKRDTLLHTMLLVRQSSLLRCNAKMT